MGRPGDGALTPSTLSQPIHVNAPTLSAWSVTTLPLAKDAAHLPKQKNGPPVRAPSAPGFVLMTVRVYVVGEDETSIVMDAEVV
jgi:hypothetical protein